MPGLNGIETTTRILAEFPDARIIVLTTYSGDVQVLRALRAGARAYLLKGHDRELTRDDSCGHGRTKEDSAGSRGGAR